MAHGYDLGPYSAGEVRLVPIAFALASGETIVTAQAAVQLWAQSPVADPHASALLLGSPFVSGSSIVSVIGGAFVAGVSGFQPGAVYTLWANAATSLGQTLENDNNFTIDPRIPPTFGSGPPAGSEYTETTNFTPSVPGTYYLNASGLTLTVPSANVGGDLLIVDITGAPNLTISGSLLNSAPVMGPYGTFTLRWSTRYSGFFWL